MVMTYRGAYARAYTHPRTRGQSRRDAKQSSSPVLLSLSLSLSPSLSSFLSRASSSSVACSRAGLHPRSRSRLSSAISPVKTARTGRSRARGREIGVVPCPYERPRAMVCVAPTSCLSRPVGADAYARERGPGPPVVGQTAAVVGQELARALAAAWRRRRELKAPRKSVGDAGPPLRTW